MQDLGGVVEEISKLSLRSRILQVLPKCDGHEPVELDFGPGTGREDRPPGGDPQVGAPGRRLSWRAADRSSGGSEPRDDDSGAKGPGTPGWLPSLG